jgi:hypothetical protein
MKTSRAKRKLVVENTLAKAYQLQQTGVPITRIIKQLGLHISRPHLTNLLHYYDIYISLSDPEQKLILYMSLFPPWLDNDYIKIQPNSWYYEGFFPWGLWKRD